MTQKSQGNDAWLRRYLREAFRPDRQVIEPLTPLKQLRLTRPASDFSRIIAAFKVAAPVSYRNLTALGARHAWELVWRRDAFHPLDLSAELQWAALWLRGHKVKINEFRAFANEIEDQIIAGKEPEALAHLDLFIKAKGWSLWAVELRAALLQATGGTVAQRAWLSELQEKATNSIPGLLFQVFGDRNDDTFSYEAVYGKCQTSFPRFSGYASWLVDYLNFRALGHVEDARTAFSGVLARDISSSFLDYYESVIECLTHLETTSDLADLRPVGRQLIQDLLDDGFVDARLSKMLFLVSDGATGLSKLESPSQPNWLRLVFAPRSIEEAPGRFGEICDDIEETRNHGAAAYDLTGKLLKWSLNHKVLDVGAAVAWTALYASTKMPDRPLPLSVSVSHASISLDEVATCGPKAAIRILRLAFPDRWPDDVHNLAAGLEYVGVDTLLERYPNVSVVHLWWAIMLQRARKHESLVRLIHWLKEKGGFWARKATIVEVELFGATGDFDRALTEVESWFRKEPRYAFEFPSEAIFSGRGWRIWKDLDPVKVANVAHYAFASTGSTSIAYICKMACRVFLQSGQRDSVITDYEAANDERKAQLVTFLREVWIEENLSMCHRFQSTAEVRIERMSVLQLLIQWESSRESEYAEAIKELTFDQTLQRGLEQINQTRIFVNESAITRWAEKELAKDYERWKRLVETSSGSRAVDDLLRQYLSDPSNDETLAALSKGKPTAADAMLMDLVDRLYRRFLLDPTDGLDTFLSLRIRHGSFKGTLLGPFEEQGLLFGTANSFSEEAFMDRWGDALKLPTGGMDSLVREIQEFSKDLRSYIDNFVNERIQITRDEKPRGAFRPHLVPQMARVLAAHLAERPLSFASFLSGTYFVFWKLVELSLDELRTEILEALSSKIRARIDQLIKAVRTRGPRCLPLLTTLTTISTTTISQCEAVSEWFRLPAAVTGEQVELKDAIDIATAATRNVYRAFSATVSVDRLPSVRLPLTTSALATITDCLFVAFENAWKHSGLGSSLGRVSVDASFDQGPRILTLQVSNQLSDERRAQLIDGELEELRHKYLGELPLNLISIEGGSGFPKLSRLARSVPREIYEEPFKFLVEEKGWTTTVSFPLYEREGVYEAYE